LLERAVRLADAFVIVPSGHTGPAGAKSAVDRKVYSGPIGHHEAEQAAQALSPSDGYRVEKVAGSGGSLTALPIIETLLGDVSAYIPTNVISITDGQIYLEGNLFYAGIRPAINVGLSVSRVGGDAQTKAMKQVAGKLRLDMAAFREVAAFAQFGSDLDKATQDQLGRGQRLQEVLKQPQYATMELEDQVISLFAATNGYADAITLEHVKTWQAAMLRSLSASHPEIGRDIAAQKRITAETEQALRQALDSFNRSWQV
jgi:F-type H+-transporting ATPase subunit alpha